MNHKQLIKIAFFIFITILVSGCATSLNTIRSQPDQYAGKKVLICGNIKHKFPIPFTEVRVYTIEDSTASMVLIGPSTYKPGAKVKTHAQVIGIAENDAVQSAKETADTLREILVSKKIADPATARKISAVVLTAVSKISSSVEGSYFLIDSHLKDS